jgi:hypothetical protein
VPIAGTRFSQRGQPGDFGRLQREKRKPKNMTTSTHTKLAIRSSLALALALAVWCPLQARSADPAGGNSMTDAGMKDRRQAMMEQKQKMMEDMKAQDAQLAELVAKMNSAPQDKKLDLLAAVVTQMAEQRAAMTARMEKMQAEMMTNMMQHMQMDKGAMPKDQKMGGMMDMGK